MPQLSHVRRIHAEDAALKARTVERQLDFRLLG